MYNVNKNKKHCVVHLYCTICLDTAKTGVKISKAALLQKGGDYLRELKLQLDEGEDEMLSCKQAISSLRSQLEILHNR